MYLTRLLPLACMLALTLAGRPDVEAGQPPRSVSIVGTWQVVECWVRDEKSGERQYPYGRQPGGYHVYDAAGHVFVQLARLPAADSLGPRWKTLPADGLRALLERHGAWFGTYRVDAARGVITEQVDADVTRERVGTSRETPFRIDGDRLLLGDGTSAQTILMRVY